MILDNTARIKKLDSDGMFQVEYNWPELIDDLFKKSINIPESVKVGNFTISYKGPISQILICGMGGSAISGDYLSVFLEKNINIPIIVRRNYEIPAFVNKETLVIFISYSGDTEETLSCLIAAIKKSAKLVCISSGGIFEELFSKYNMPLFKIRSGYHPRASLPLLFFPLLIIFDKLDIVGFTLEKDEIEETISVLHQMREELKPEIPLSTNNAKQVAKQIYNHIPVIWSCYYCIANRMKCQLNENAKIIALSEELPELNHNHIMGWESQPENSPFIVLLYRFKNEHPNVALRFEITKEIIQKKTQIIEISARGTSILSQLFSITYFGDYVSMYLAILNNEDPNIVKSISHLKDQLEKRKKTRSILLQELKDTINEND